MRWQRGHYIIDDDRARLDLPALTAWLQATYWAWGRTSERIERSWQASGVVFGVYTEEQQIGCARVVTDFTTIAYLADVYLVPEARGLGLGRWLVTTIVEHPELVDARWLLYSRDKQPLYRQVGFTTPSERLMERSLAPGITSRGHNGAG